MKGYAFILAVALSACFLMLSNCSQTNPVFEPLTGNDQTPYGNVQQTPFGLASHISVPLPSTNGICLKGKIFQLPVGSDHIPDLDSLSPVGHLKATRLNVPPQDWMTGFPGVDQIFEWFAIDYRGNIRIDSSDTYYFTLKSDDGLILFIDGVKVVDNDGLHPPWDPVKTGSIGLSAGIHQVRVWYFQGPRYHVQLQVLINKGAAAPIEIDDVTGGLKGASLNYILDLSVVGAPN
jgi:hypothetical protein